MNFSSIYRYIFVLIAFLLINTTCVYTQHSGTSSSIVRRDSHGRIKRSESARDKFMKQTGFPNGRPGYVIDHIVPLANGGKDDPSNMQWQTVTDAKAKDKWERGQSAHQAKKYSSSVTKHSSGTTKRNYKTTSSKSSSSSSHKDVYVGSYTNKKGHTVKSHYRSSHGMGTHRSSSSSHNYSSSHRRK